MSPSSWISPNTRKFSSVKSLTNSWERSTEVNTNDDFSLCNFETCKVTHDCCIFKKSDLFCSPINLVFWTFPLKCSARSAPPRIYEAYGPIKLHRRCWNPNLIYNASHKLKYKKLIEVIDGSGGSIREESRITRHRQRNVVCSGSWQTLSDRPTLHLIRSFTPTLSQLVLSYPVGRLQKQKEHAYSEDNLLIIILCHLIAIWEKIRIRTKLKIRLIRKMWLKMWVSEEANSRVVSASYGERLAT